MFKWVILLIAIAAVLMCVDFDTVVNKNSIYCKTNMHKYNPWVKCE